MASTIESPHVSGASALAHAAAQYADAKSRDDGTSENAWQKIIYSLLASKQHTLV